MVEGDKREGKIVLKIKKQTLWIPLKHNEAAGSLVFHSAVEFHAFASL